MEVNTNKNNFNRQPFLLKWIVMFLAVLISITLVDYLFERSEFLNYSEKEKMIFLRTNAVQSFISSLFIVLFFKYVKFGISKKK